MDELSSLINTAIDRGAGQEWQRTVLTVSLCRALILRLIVRRADVLVSARAEKLLKQF
jgi:hypothetical protein